MLPILEKLIGGGVKSIADGVSSVIDSINAPKEEKEKAMQAIQAELNRHQEAMLVEADSVEKAYLVDVADSRQANARIQESEKASWMAKNTAYMIDLFIIALWGALTAYVLASMLHLVEKVVGVDYTGVTAIWGGVTALATQIIGFHRGSSQGSADKQKLIDKMTQPPVK